jgi:nitronate monooxygenase
MKVIHKCTSVRHALKAEKIGCDAVSIDGFECAGHPGEDDVTSLILIPATCDALKIPIVASGGFGDGRGLIAALGLGAEGMNMGSRFVATKEAPVHHNVKQEMVAKTERDTTLIMRPLRNTERVLNNAGIDKILAMEKEKGANVKFEDIIAQVGGVYPRIMQQGDMDAGAWSCGMVAGLIHDVPSVKELIDRIMKEAEDIIGKRLKGMAA